jgi:hypothetical protein
MTGFRGLFSRGFRFTLNISIFGSIVLSALEASGIISTIPVLVLFLLLKTYSAIHPTSSYITRRRPRMHLSSTSELRILRDKGDNT